MKLLLFQRRQRRKTQDTRWMKIPIVLTSSILCLLSLLIVPSAHALSTLCEQILALPSVSTHYVQRVIDRANAALEHADSKPVNADFVEYLPAWTKSFFSSAVALIDTTHRLTLNTLSLEDHTACLTLDTMRLHCQIEKTLDSIQGSLSKGSWAAIAQKQVLLLFLDESMKHLQAGFADPNYAATGWGVRRIFDAPSYVVSTPAEGPLCPAHTDYFPVARSYGCALPILFPRKPYEPADAEYQGLLAITEQIDTNRLLGQDLAELERQIAALRSGVEPDPPTAPETPVHLTGYGCAMLPGFCSLDRTLRCAKSEICAAQSKGTCVLDTGYCERNTYHRCSADTDCSAQNLGACVLTPPPEALRFVLRGPFNVWENTLGLLQRYLNFKVQQGGSRLYRTSLQLESERPVGSPPRLNDPFSDMGRTAGRIVIRSWSRLQAAWEAAIFPRATDVSLALADASELRAPIAALTRLVRDDDGLESFITGMTYDFRLTCMFRPCRAKLEHILKINMADECFRYANNKFIDDLENIDNPEAIPGWQQCAMDACLRLPGLVLPAKCDSIP